MVVPPASDGGPTSNVHVADYGYHSSLILPKPDGNLVEYTYGDWTYFAQNQKSFGTMAAALLNSDQATLGRRILPESSDLETLREALGAKTLVRFAAPGPSVSRLEHELETRYTANLPTLIYAPAHKAYFVKDDQPYSWLHNCNHMTAHWLEQLGCHVEGWVMLSRFSVRGPSQVAQEPASSRS